MATSIPLEQLFDAQFLASVQQLRIIAKRVPAGGRFAEQRSRAMGHGIEFRDYRAYVPGDDLRAIDWNIYRRLGRVFLRLFEEFEDLPLYLLPDVSKSSFMEEPARARAGLRTALALTAISLGQHDSVGIFPFAEDLQMLVRPQSGSNRLMTFASHLARIEAGGATDIVAALKRFNTFGLRKGLVTIVSDFFDPAGIEPVIEALGRMRHKLLLVQLVRKDDREPDLSGDLRLHDCESGASEDVSVNAAVLERYRGAYDRFQDQLNDFAKRRGAGLLRLDVDEEIVPQLAHLFESRRYSV